MFESDRAYIMPACTTLTGPHDTMIVREGYRNRTHVVCRDHWHGRKALPADAPSLGPVEDARESGRCEFCS